MHRRFVKLSPPAPSRDPIAALHVKIDDALDWHWARPDRAYRPNVTLARRRAVAAKPAIWIEHETEFHGESVTIDRFTFFESPSSRRAAQYEGAGRYPLTRAADAIEFAKGGSPR